MTVPQDAPALAGLADSHCHLNAGAFDGISDVIVARSRRRRTMIVVGLDPGFERAMDLARQHGGAGHRGDR